MNYFVITLLSLLVLLALLIPGFIMKKVKLLSDKAVKDFSNVLLYIGTPFLVFTTILDADIHSAGWLNIILCVLLTVVVHIAGIALCYLFSMKDTDKAKKAVSAFTSAFSNCGFLGIPLAAAIVPQQYKAEALLYVALYNVVFNFLSWIAGSFLFRRPGEKFEIKMLTRAVLNPCSLSFIIALPFALTGFKLLEVEYIGKFISYLAGLAVPVSMLVLGMRVACIDFKKAVKSIRMYQNCLIRLVLVPLITFGIVLLLNLILNVGAAFIIAITLMAAMPTAASTIAFAERFDADSLYASETVISSTLFSIITIPCIMLLLSLL